MGNNLSKNKNKKFKNRKVEILFLKFLRFKGKKMFGLIKVTKKINPEIFRISLFQKLDKVFKKDYLKKFNLKNKRLILDEIIPTNNILKIKGNIFIYFFIEIKKDLNLYEKDKYKNYLSTLKGYDYLINFNIDNFTLKKNVQIKKFDNYPKNLTKNEFKKKKLNFLNCEIFFLIKKKIFLNGDFLVIKISHNNLKNFKKMNLSCKFIQFFKINNNLNEKKNYEKKIVIKKLNFKNIKDYEYEKLRRKISIRRLPISFENDYFELSYRLNFFVKRKVIFSEIVKIFH